MLDDPVTYAPRPYAVNLLTAEIIRIGGIIEVRCVYGIPTHTTLVHQRFQQPLPPNI